VVGLQVKFHPPLPPPYQGGEQPPWDAISPLETWARRAILGHQQQIRIGVSVMLRRMAFFVMVVAFTAASLVAQNDAPSEAPTMNRSGKGILDVVVLDQANQPLKGVTVSVPGYKSTTGAGGTARFGLLPARYAVLIAKDGYRGQRINAGVRPGETTTLKVTLQKLPAK
jgi:hypothetical protein